ncbi:MAG: hypothetical protein QNK36_20335 [Colwellia sp.]|nr:hypothetical protein [Colwellia sp.]
MSMIINKTLAIDMKHDFVTRLFSLGKTQKNIQQLDLYLDLSLDNINGLAKYS